MPKDSTQAARQDVVAPSFLGSTPENPRGNATTSTMLSTLSLLLPAPVHSNLSRLRHSALPDYDDDAQEWPETRPTSSSSAATSSVPDTPPRRKGFAGASGASTPVCEAALVRGVRERLETGMGSSGIDWDSVRRGMSSSAPRV
ncbi:hypothetical protein IMZ48_37845 [Candidatus Bathyarchaeota archaeon]|nr:hypothetical protein [Candidatus Bathyarchaeota archaeon]